jgi:hypothetical protein
MVPEAIVVRPPGSVGHGLGSVAQVGFALGARSHTVGLSLWTTGEPVTTNAPAPRVQ